MKFTSQTLVDYYAYWHKHSTNISAKRTLRIAESELVIGYNNNLLVIHYPSYLGPTFHPLTLTTNGAH